MVKISDVLKELIDKNQFLHFGFSHRLLNLSQTAEWIKPLLKARIKKNVSTSAILMSLSRMVRTRSKILPSMQRMKVASMNVYNDLCELTFDKGSVVQQFLDKAYLQIQKRNGYMTISQGISEITIIVGHDCLGIIKKEIRAKPKFVKDKLAALGVQFDSKYVTNPGMFYYLIQQLTLQNINIWEVSSTYTELIFYIAQNDIRLAFDTLSQAF